MVRVFEYNSLYCVFALSQTIMTIISRRGGGFRCAVPEKEAKTVGKTVLMAGGNVHSAGMV